MCLNMLIIFLFLLHEYMAMDGQKSQLERLYDDLMVGYNPLVRPVLNASDRVLLKMGLSLSQLIEVNLKNQIMSTNVWVEHEWYDFNLRWDPDEYQGVQKLHLPAEQIWLPDIVLYNNADGNYEITILTKAIVYSDGKVKWRPPATYKSSCEIDVEFFPFDRHTCFMKFTTWAHSGQSIELKHINQSIDKPEVEIGMDLTRFYLSVEWDIMSVPAICKINTYSCCDNLYYDLMFFLALRRKTLFYTVNLIIPCVAISALSIVVFYLPSDSGEKISLSISIMLSLIVFFLLLSEIIPPTSLAIPLLGKYLVFTLVLVTLSVFVTIIVLNVNFRSPSTHKMAPWVEIVFIKFLPKILNIKRPKKEKQKKNTSNTDETNGKNTSLNSNNDDSSDFPVPVSGRRIDEEFRINYENSVLSAYNARIEANDISMAQEVENDESILPANKEKSHLEKAILSIQFIAQHMENLDNYYEIEEDWKFVAMVLDRLFLWIFAITCIVGTAGIILQAPSLYDTAEPIDVIYSKMKNTK